MTIKKEFAINDVVNWSMPDGKENELWLVTGWGQPGSGMTFSDYVKDFRSYDEVEQKYSKNWVIITAVGEKITVVIDMEKLYDECYIIHTSIVQPAEINDDPDYEDCYHNCNCCYCSR